MVPNKFKLVEVDILMRDLTPRAQEHIIQAYKKCGWKAPDDFSIITTVEIYNNEEREI